MLSGLLAPFSWLYGAVMRFRNFCYDQGWRKSFVFEQAVVVVGNLSLGGTGKTPMIEYLVRLLANQYTVATLSRGYGRASTGFRQATEKDNASTLGDEPFQFFQKFKDKVAVFVCENRVEGIEKALAIQPGIQVFLLDDAFQHRRVRPLLSILLTDFSKPFFSDFVLPRGRLREPRKGSQRADVVVVTKCPELRMEVEQKYTDEMVAYAGNKPIFFSKIKYTEPVSMGDGEIKKELVLVTGVADSTALKNYLSANFTLVAHFNFGDHHSYSINEIEAIERISGDKNASVITTEKDYAKLIHMGITSKLWFYLPIESQIINNGSEFDRRVLEKIENHLSKY